ncbi:MAG TPA: potassium/proton antiporter [Flavobacterium sp.]|nr:potassium/proton antiporter [Flavobacterium sp.]
MNLSIENILLIGSLLLLVSIIAGKTSYKFGVPTLILFLAIGMLAGSEGPGGINFDDPQLAQFIGIVSLNFILFSGGLDTSWSSIKPILWQGISLSTLGVLITAFSVGFFVYYITDFTIYESLLLGSIVSSTDAAAVFSILRSKSLALKSNIRPTLELESGSNDPMAYVLTIAFLSLVVSQNQDQSVLSVIPLFLQQMIIGSIAGLLFGKLSKIIINKIMLDFEGLYPVLVISLMFITFSATDFIGGNGFLAIYLCAVFLGNQDLIHKKTILKMFDGLAWLMQIVLFLTLGLLVFPSHIIPVIGIGLLISAFMILVARPIGVFLSLLPFNLKTRKKVYISWVGLRGAVPIVFATYPLLAGIEKAEMIFNIVFLITLTSILIQGTTLSVFAKWLHVLLPEKVKLKGPLEIFFDENPKSEIKEIFLKETDYAVGKKIVNLGFPKNALITMIKRDDKYITPKGTTVLEGGDVLIVLSDKQEALDAVQEILTNEEKILKSRFIIYIDFSESNHSLIQNAIQLAKNHQVEFYLVHQINLLLPKFIDNVEKLIAIRSQKNSALVALKELSKSYFPNDAALHLLVSNKSIDKIDKELHDSEFDNYVFIGFKKTSYFKKHIVGTFTTQLNDAANDCLFALPPMNSVASINEFYIGINKSENFNLNALNKVINYFPSLRKIYLFTISNDSENLLLSNDLIEKIKNKVDSEVEVSYIVLPDIERLKSIITHKEDQINKVLIIQKGPRTLRDKVFRSFFTNEFLFDGQYPILILPRKEKVISIS